MERYVAPLVLAAELKNVVGRTRYQKIVCLLEAVGRRGGGFETGFQFQIYLHGPYSEDLSRTIDELVTLGRLREIQELTASGNLRCTYHLTSEGTRALREFVAHRMVPLAMQSAARAIARDYGEMPLPELIREAYGVYEDLHSGDGVRTNPTKSLA